MNQIYSSVITACITVLIGVVIFVLEKLIEKFYIEPILKQKEVIGEIADRLIYFANLYSNPLQLQDLDLTIDKNKKILGMYEDAMYKIRALSSSLNSKTQQISSYKFLERLKIVSPLENIFEASKNLIGLSNSLSVRGNFMGDVVDISSKNMKRVDEIRKELNLLPENALIKD